MIQPWWSPTHRCSGPAVPGVTQTLLFHPVHPWGLPLLHSLHTRVTRTLLFHPLHPWSHSNPTIPSPAFLGSLIFPSPASLGSLKPRYSICCTPGIPHFFHPLHPWDPKFFHPLHPWCPPLLHPLSPGWCPHATALVPRRRWPGGAGQPRFSPGARR